MNNLGNEIEKLKSENIKLQAENKELNEKIEGKEKLEKTIVLYAVVFVAICLVLVFFICLRNDFRVIDFCPEMKTLISILFVMMVVGCGKTEAEKREEEDSKESVKELTKEDVFRSYEFGNEKLVFRRL